MNLSRRFPDMALAVFLLIAQILFLPVAGFADEDTPVRLQVAEAWGDLTITGEASTPEYFAYVHVPVETENQVPIWIEMSGDQLIDYRFIPTTNHNILAVARMRSAPASILSWRSWTLIDQQYYNDVPTLLSMDTLNDLPDSTLPYLQATATAQVNCQPILDWTTAHAGMWYLDIVVGAAYQRAVAIPETFSHSPTSFDAYYAMTWGGSCTSHAHALTALVRGMGIPARTKLALLSWYSEPYDCHWTCDIFFPGYGWVGADASSREYPMAAQKEIVLYQCEPGDEFPMFFKNGIDGFWHTSDLLLGDRNPSFRLSSRNPGFSFFYCLPEQRDELFTLARRTFNADVLCRGTARPIDEMGRLAAAQSYRHSAKAALDLGLLELGLERMALADAEYAEIKIGSLETRFESDFENGPVGWSHGGSRDEWEWGTPGVDELQTAYSGDKLWGIDLNGTYGPNADSWLKTPPIELNDLYSAQLEFRVWIQTAGTASGGYGDCLWLDITTDGLTYSPLCSPMVGGSVDPAIPVVTGWSRMDLDLTPYVGETVQVRFRFHSDGADTREGAYIDDVMVTGRAARISGVSEDDLPDATHVLALSAYPNPFNPRTHIAFELQNSAHVRCVLYDMAGKRIAQLVDRIFAEGPHALNWDGRDATGRSVPSGAYLLRLEAGTEVRSLKLMLLR